MVFESSHWKRRYAYQLPVFLQNIDVQVHDKVLQFRGEIRSFVVVCTR